MSEETYYTVLNVSETASVSEIKTAYRDLIKQVHPDTIFDLAPYLRRIAEEKAKEITEAYSVLSSSSKRREYDRQLAEYRRQTTPKAPTPPPPPTPSPAQQAGSQTSSGPYCNRCGTLLYANGSCPKCDKSTTSTATPQQPMAVRFRCWLYDHPILALALPGFFFLIAILILNYHHASPQAPPEPTQPSSGRNEVPPPESSEHKLIFSPEASRGQLVHQEKPVYPPLARQARIQGTVVLKALISKTGDIEGLHLVSGHPMLAPAAIVAVKQWKYKPYLLNGEPVEVETTINVNFRLADAE